MITAAAALLWFLPISSRWSDRIIREQWRAATGLELNFSKAEIGISRGVLRIDSPVLRHPETQEALLDLASAEVRVRIGSVLSALTSENRPVAIEFIRFQGPVDFGIERRDGQIRLSPKLQQLADILSADGEVAAAGANGGKPMRFQVGTISVQGVSVSLDRVDGLSRWPEAAIRRAELVADYDGTSSPVRMVLVGEIAGRDGIAEFNVKFRPALERDEIAMDIAVLPFDSRKHLLADLPMDFETGRIEATGLLTRQPNKDWALNSEAKIPAVTLFGAGVHGVDQRFEKGVLNASLQLAQSENALKVVAVSFESQECSLRGAGELSLAEPYQYSLRLDPLELRAQGLAMAQRSVLGENYIARPDEGKLVLRGDVAGILREKIPSRLSGDIAIEQVMLEFPDLSQPISDLAINASVTTSTLTLKEGYAVVQGIPLRLEGNLSGRMLAGEIEHAEIAWQTTGNAAGISDLIAKSAGDDGAEFTFSGNVTGSGYLKFDYPELANMKAMLENAESRGELRFNGAEFRHRHMAKPIEQLSGSIEFTRNQATLKDITGLLEGAKLGLSGTITGEKHFLSDATANLTVQADLRLQDGENYFRVFGKQPPDFRSSAGRVELKTTLTGAVNDWKQVRYQGSAAIRDFVLPLNSEYAGGTIRAPIVQIEFSPEQLRINEAKGNWEGVSFLAHGGFTPDEGVVNASVEGKLDEVQTILPRLLDQMDVLGGNAMAQHRSEFKRVDAETRPAATFNELFAMMNKSGEKRPEDLKNSWQMSISGDVRLNEGSVRHAAMPLDSVLTGIYGEGKYDDTALWTTTPAVVKPGVNSQAAEVNARIQFYKPDKQMGLLEFEGSGNFLNLDDWLHGWRKMELRKPPTPPSGSPFDPDAAPKIKIVVKLKSNGTTYRTVAGENLNGVVVYELFGRGKSRLSWNDVNAQAKGGSVLVNGSFIRNDERWVQNWRFNSQNMDVGDVLTGAFGAKDRRGLSSGQVTGQLRLHSDGPKGTRFDGEGHLLVQNSKFTSNAIFSRIGGLLKLEDLFNDITFTRVEGDFRVVDGGVVIDSGKPLLFENPSRLHPLSIETVGTVSHDRQLNLMMNLQFFPVVGDIPLVGAIWRTLTGRILRYSVKGTLDNPDVSVGIPIVPTSAERGS